jgi:hypothetical protein
VETYAASIIAAHVGIPTMKFTAILLVMTRVSGSAVAAVILKSEIYNFHRLDLTRQTGFIVTVYDEDGLKLAVTDPCSTPTEAFAEARKIVDNKIEGPRKK